MDPRKAARDFGVVDDADNLSSDEQDGIHRSELTLMSGVGDAGAELAEVMAGVQDATRQHGHELPNIPGAITVRPGYRVADGTSMNAPVVAAWSASRHTVLETEDFHRRIISDEPIYQRRRSHHD